MLKKLIAVNKPENRKKWCKFSLCKNIICYSWLYIDQFCCVKFVNGFPILIYFLSRGKANLTVIIQNMKKGDDKENNRNIFLLNKNIKKGNN